MRAFGKKVKRVAILGAGLSGLTIGWKLHRMGIRVDIFEREDSVGGLLRSKNINGFMYDISGGHIIYSKNKQILNFILKLLGKNVNQIKRDTRWLWRGEYFRYPIEYGIGDMPNSLRFECVKDYIDAHYRRKYDIYDVPENLYDWLIWRFGDTLAREFLLPYNEKLWKTSLRSIGINWVDGKIPDPPLDDVLKSALGQFCEGYKHQSTFFYPRAGGIQSIADCLAKPIKKNILLSTPVRNVKKTNSGFKVNDSEYDIVINTLPPQEFLSRYDGVDSDIKRAVSNLPYLSLVTIFIGLKEKHKNNYSWIYIPNEKDSMVHKVTYLSNYSKEITPNGKGSILAEITFRGSQFFNENFVQKVIHSLHDCGLLNENKVCDQDLSVTKYAYIIPTHSLEKNRRKIIDFLDSEGILYTGRFGGYKYLNMDMCIKEALDLYEKLKGGINL